MQLLLALSKAMGHFRCRKSTLLYMSGVSLRRVAPESIKGANQFSLTDDVRAAVTPIVNAVRSGGKAALIEQAVKFGDIPNASAKIVFSKDDLKQAYDSISSDERDVMERVAHRVRLFATAQRTSIKSIVSRVPGGYAMQDISAVECAGCYAPGGRYPLPSSVIMTAATARVAGCSQVWVASPKPSPVILAAAYIADADGLIGIGGAQAIAALAYGVEGIVPQCNAVVGPGNKYVTAAKAMVSGIVAIDMLAGPSECLVFADDSANAEIVAADLLAQAEHDVDAVPILVTTSEEFARKVDLEINKQLSVLRTADVARVSVSNNGMAIVVSSLDQGVEICNFLAPEHLEVHVKENTGTSSVLWGQSLLSERFTNYGCLFVGEGSAEVIGDYGAGPNHTLPTSGAARSFGGLSVFSFLRIRTRLAIDNEQKAAILYRDAAQMAEMEGLFGHAAAARCRMNIPVPLSPASLDKKEPLKMALPKGRMMEQVLKLFKDAGIPVQLDGRVLRASIANLPSIDIKLLNPRNVVEMVGNGARDVGFVGWDLVEELNADVHQIFDTGLDPVKIVCAAPASILVNGELPRDRRIVVASEYENLSRRWLREQKVPHIFRRTFGATEVFPPEDADCIIDNTATGTTLKANNLVIIGTPVYESSTRMVVTPSLLEDAAKMQLVKRLEIILTGVLAARSRIMVECNCPAACLSAVVAAMPCMKRPTISPLYADATEAMGTSASVAKDFALKGAVPRKQLVEVMQALSAAGATDILVSEPSMLLN